MRTVPPLSLAHLSELNLSPRELVKAAKISGFASVGFRTNPAAPGAISYPLTTTAEQKEIRDLSNSTGVSVLYIELISLSEATQPKDHLAMLETGAAIGATRLAVAGDSADFNVIAEKMAGLCELAGPLGIAVDLEFMPFREVKSFADARTVVMRTGCANAHILVDALHVFRSNSSLADIKSTDPKLLGTFQLCDAPRMAPPPDQLVVEARTRRMRPGFGGLDLSGLMSALPANLPIGLEVPLAGELPDATPVKRLSTLAQSTHDFFNEQSPR